MVPRLRLSQRQRWVRSGSSREARRSSPVRALVPPEPLVRPPSAQPVARFCPFGLFGPHRAGLRHPERETAGNSSPPAFRLEDLHKLFPKASHPHETYSLSI